MNSNIKCQAEKIIGELEFNLENKFVQSICELYKNQDYIGRYICYYKTFNNITCTEDSIIEENNKIKKNLYNKVYRWKGPKGATPDRSMIILHCLAAKKSSSECNNYLDYYNYVPLKYRSVEDLIYIICMDHGGDFENLYSLVYEFEYVGANISDSFNKYPETFANITISSFASTTKLIDTTISKNFIASYDNCKQLIQDYKASFGNFTAMRIYIFRRILGIDKKYERGTKYHKRDYSDNIFDVSKSIPYVLNIVDKPLDKESGYDVNYNDDPSLRTYKTIYNIITDILNTRNDVNKSFLTLLMLLNKYPLDKINKYLILCGYSALSGKNTYERLYIDIQRLIDKYSIDSQEIIRTYDGLFYNKTGRKLFGYMGYGSK